MNTRNLFLLAGLALSLSFTSCEKEEIIPAQTEVPAQDSRNDDGNGNTPTPGNGTPTPGNTPTPGTANPPVNNAPALAAPLIRLGQTQWSYDTQNRFAGYDSYHMNDEYTVVYEGDRPARLDFSTGHYLVYEWEGDKVVGAKKYAAGGMEIHWFQFEYKGDKLVKKISSSYYPDYTRGWLQVNEFAYDTKGNLLTLSVRYAQSDKMEDLGQETIISWGNYDDKPNPKPYAESDIYLPGVKLFENNPGFREAGSREIYSYLYHESGLPSVRYDRVEGYAHVPAIANLYEYQ